MIVMRGFLEEAGKREERTIMAVLSVLREVSTKSGLKGGLFVYLVFISVRIIPYLLRKSLGVAKVKGTLGIWRSRNHIHQWRIRLLNINIDTNTHV